MKEEAIVKINKMGKVGSVILKIARVVCYVGLAGVLMALIAVLILPKDLMDLSIGTNVGVTMDVSELGVQMDDTLQARVVNGIANGFIKADSKKINLSDINIDGDVITANTESDLITKLGLSDLYKPMAVALVAIAVTILALYFAGSFCNTLENCTSPFDDTVINKLRNFAYSLIPLVLCDSVMKSTKDIILSQGTDINFSINFLMVFVVLAILALSYIFKYGAMLQKESDETL